MSPLKLFRTVAIAEAITWALLLFGMFLKYVTETTELGVRIFGMLHGVVFIAYGLVTLLVWADRRWTLAKGILGLVSAIPPFMTVWFDRHAERKGLLGETWQSGPDSAATSQRAVSWLLRNPLPAAGVFVLALVVLTSVALVVGPPVG